MKTSICLISVWVSSLSPWPASLTLATETNLIGVKHCHGFKWVQTLGWLVAFTTPPLHCFTPLWLLSTVALGCVASAGLSHTIPLLLRAEAALKEQHFHPTAFHMSGLQRGWVIKGRREGQAAWRGDAADWWWTGRRGTKVVCLGEY